MRKPELELVRFESGDVIATSGNDPVYLVLANLGNDFAGDNTLSIKNGPYNGQSVTNVDSNARKELEPVRNSAITLIENAFGLSGVTREMRFYRADKHYYFTLSELFAPKAMGDGSVYDSILNGEYSYDANLEDGSFLQIKITN